MADLGVLLCAVTDVTPINFKGPHFKSTPPPLTLLNPTFLFLCCCLSAGSMGSQLYVVLYTASLLLFSTPPAVQPVHSQRQTLFFGEKDRLKCPMQPAAAAPGPRHSSAQKRREGPGLAAPLFGAPPVVFCSLCPLMGA